MSGSTISKKRREHLGFCAENMSNLSSCLVIAWFQYGISFRREIWLDVGPTQSDLRIFAWKKIQACLWVPAVGSFRRKNDGGEMLFSYENDRPLLTFSEAFGRWGHVFAISASPRCWTRKWLCHHPPLFAAVSMILNMWHSCILLHATFMADKIWGDKRELAGSTPKIRLLFGLV